MDTFLVIVVLLIVIALLASIGYFFVREAGPENVQHWLTAPRQLRDSVTAIVSRPAQTRSIDGNEPGVKLEAGAARRLGGRLGAGSGSGTALVRIDETALRELKEEFQGELRNAAGLTREFDARLNRMEAALSDARKAPQEFERTLRDRDERQRREIDRLQQELGTMRLTMGAFGQRRGEALADFYGHLARVEVAMAAVINPMLLPGESLVLPSDLLPETLVWSNWNDVGERAFAFGNVFNQNRFVLEPETAAPIEAFIVTLRQVLTRDVYPAVRDGNPTAPQIVQMRAGLESIVRDLPVVRRLLEDAYRQHVNPVPASSSAGSSATAADDSPKATPVAPAGDEFDL